MAKDIACRIRFVGTDNRDGDDAVNTRLGLVGMNQRR